MAQRLTAGEKILRGITEAQWQANVVTFARFNGWKVYHPPNNRPVNGRIQKVMAGWPDLAFMREGEFILAELKTELGKTTADQDECIRLLRSAGIEVHVWRPSDGQKMQGILRRPKR